MGWRMSEQWRDNVETLELWPGDRVKWRKVEFAIYSTFQDGTVDLWDERTKRIIGNVKASELEVN